MQHHKLINSSEGLFYRPELKMVKYLDFLTYLYISHLIQTKGIGHKNIFSINVV